MGAQQFNLILLNLALKKNITVTRQTVIPQKQATSRITHLAQTNNKVQNHQNPSSSLQALQGIQNTDPPKTQGQDTQNTGVSSHTQDTQNTSVLTRAPKGSSAQTSGKTQPPKNKHLKKTRSTKIQEAMKNKDAFLTTDLTEEEQATLAILESKWEARSEMMRKTSQESWQATQHRFLPLLCLPPTEMEEEFELRRDCFEWTYGTAGQYWSALIKAAETVGIAITFHMRQVAKVYKFLKNEEDPKRPTKPIQEPILLAAVCQLQSQDKQGAALALQISYVLGQRVGDTLKLMAKSIDTVRDEATSLTFVALTYRYGKTTRRRAPYTVHLDGETDLAQELLSWSATRQDNSSPLFGDNLTVLGDIRDALKTQDAELCILSVRRGGLQRMALAGLSQETILHHSRHSTISMLDRYLEWGKLSLNAARELVSLARTRRDQERPGVSPNSTSTAGTSF